MDRRDVRAIVEHLTKMLVWDCHGEGASGSIVAVGTPEWKVIGWIEVCWRTVREDEGQYVRVRASGRCKPRIVMQELSEEERALVGVVRMDGVVETESWRWCVGVTEGV